MTRREQANTLGLHASNTKEMSMLNSTPDSHSAHMSSTTPTARSLELSRHQNVGRDKHRAERRERLKRYAASVHQAVLFWKTAHEATPMTGEASLGPAEAPPNDGGGARYLGVGFLAAFLLLASACGESTATAAPVTIEAQVDTTTTAGATTPGATTGPLELVGTYDGENCSYEGPETATLSDEISLTLVNDSAEPVILKVNLISPDRLTDIVPLVGSDTEYSSETALYPTFYAEASPFGESSARAFLPAPGTYVVECVLGGAIPIHVWWLAALEVTP